MKIKAYSTLQEAEKNLRSIFYQNGNIFSKLFDHGMAMIKNARQGKENAPEEELEALVNKVREAILQLGSKENITLPLKLYNCNHGYALEIQYIGPPETVAGYFKTTEKLAQVARKKTKKTFAHEFGIQTSPFFYTVEEPHRLSEEMKERYKQIAYQKIAKNKHWEVDAYLQAYVEYGLGTEERQEFEKTYLKFFN